MSKELDKKIRALNFKNVSDKIKKERKQVHTKESSEDQRITTLDQQIENAKKLIEIYSKDNEILKKKCNTDSPSESQNKYKLIEKGKQYDISIASGLNEIKLLKKQLAEHLKCGKEKNNL